ncbi:MAG: GAF domain-containing protein, partial [Syntrophales bacterium]|nr:GAF domain-containing protein [Syntrophales bacterium]
MANKGLSYKLNIIFGLFFLVPVVGFLFFALRHDLLSDRAVPFYFIFLLVFYLLGVIILRSVFDRVTGISRGLTERISSLSLENPVDKSGDELKVITESFSAVEDRFSVVRSRLERKESDISILKELSDLCYVTLDPEEVLYITLERALKLADADIGSVMMIDPDDRSQFVVRASIGLGSVVSVGQRVDFSGSIAKYAVINKSPLVIENIETDSRFGRINRPQYGTKSFICLPIKTIRDIIGVITISRRVDDTPFSADILSVITPLVSNAAFTFENLRMMRERERDLRIFQVLERVTDALGSSLRGRELVQAILNEVRSETVFQRAVVFVRYETRPEELQLYDFYESKKSNLKQGMRYSAHSSFFERVFRQGDYLVINDASDLATSPEVDIFDDGAGSALVIPLKNDGTVIGVLLLGGLQVDRLASTRSLMEQVGSAISMAIVRDELSLAVSRRGSELATLRQIGGALASSTFDMNKVLSYTMDMIKSAINVEAGSLILVEGNELHFTVAFGMDIEELRKTPLAKGQGIAGYVTARGESLLVNDIMTSKFFHSEIDTKIPFITRSVLAVPLISQGRVIGVLKVLNKSTGDFNNDDMQLLQSIASSVSIALENARLYRETLLLAEHEREVRRIFQKFVPKEIVDKIIHGTETGMKVRDEFRTLTLLNLDIRGFSGLAKRIGPQKTVSFLNYFFSVMGEIVFKNDGIVDKYLGDGFLALFGAPMSSVSDADN